MSASGRTSSRPDCRVTGLKRISAGELRQDTHRRTRSGSLRSTSSEANGAADESHARRTAARRPGHTATRGVVAMQRQLGMARWLTLPRQGAKLPFPSECEMRTVAKI